MEVDVLLERRDGGVVAIEIKASSSPRAQDTRWLAQLRDRLGERFIQGVVLHLGSDIVPFGDRIRALPLSAIWT